MTNETEKKPKPKFKIKHVFAGLTLLVAAIAALPPFLALRKHEDPRAAYPQLILNLRQFFGGGSTIHSDPPPPVDPAQDQKPPPPPPPPPPVQAEFPMDRMSTDARLTMTLVSLRPMGPNARQIIATYALKSVGAPSQPFVLSDGNQEGWSVEADHAGHCWQTKASALDAFYRSELDAKIPQLPTMSPGQVFYIRAELFCDANPLAGDTAVATATPYVLATDGSRTALPIRFQSGRVPVTP